MLRELREQHQKYKYIEQEILQRKKRLSFKQPEIQKCLNAVNMLLQRQEAGEAVSCCCCCCPAEDRHLSSREQLGAAWEGCLGQWAITLVDVDQWGSTWCCDRAVELC